MMKLRRKKCPVTLTVMLGLLLSVSLFFNMKYLTNTFTIQRKEVNQAGSERWAELKEVEKHYETRSIVNNCLKPGNQPISTLPMSVDCSLWNFEEEWKETSKPQIVLNHQRLLYPGLMWGPNNQFVGLKQAIYLAIRLNRTIVIPRFRPQLSNDVLSAFQTIDVKRLCRFVSCVTIDQQKHYCNDSFHVAIQGMIAKKGDIKKYERDTGMNIFDVKEYSSRKIPGSTKLRLKQKRFQSNIPALPGDDYKLEINHWISANSATLEKAFGTSAACAIFACVFRPMDLSLNNDLAVPLQNGDDVRKLPDDVVYSAVTDALRHPPCIINAAERYVQEVFDDKPYATVHWRYNKNDWGTLCAYVNVINEEEKHVCENVFNINPGDVAHGIARILSNDSLLTDSTCDVVIYFSAPPSLDSFKKDFYEEIAKINTRFVKPRLDSMKFLEQNFGNCWKSNGWTHLNEVLSMVEMEIMKTSSWFFYSLGSTWSNNVRPFRWIKLKNGQIKKTAEYSAYDVALKSMKTHINSKN